MKKRYMVTVNCKEIRFYHIGCESWGGIPLGIRKRTHFIYGVEPEKYFRFKLIAKFYMWFISNLSRSYDFTKTRWAVLHEVQNET